ncbi:15-hydroxyprostaglandin dehydrogenase [NAD(+)]-like [Athalia rosae]|uniref:15-hydroxyprostaglandin dehydrogenase [NAD(+)]-like n=1 Tax=Athalia rosae TaxID=37344 RepID=UPI002033F7CD|nr:15-hydroxyprostaglandin dehydrogenase [NAD(+)]-like [Athalia rosae]
MQIKNKLALVTGGANGMGFSYARELLRNGASHVAILDLINSTGQEAVNKLNAEFGKRRAIFIACDVSKPQELEAGFARTVQEFGGLEIIINNAGIMDDSRWELMINVNVNAVVRGTLLGMQYMGKDRGGKGGVIVNIAAIPGALPTAECFPVYTGTKHGIIGLTTAFAMPYHYEKTGVRMLIMCPGMTKTDLISKVPEKLSNSSMSPEDYKEALKKFPSQTVDSVAHGMMHIIRSAKNGSIWIAEGGEPVYQILIPDRLVTKV